MASKAPRLLGILLPILLLVIGLLTAVLTTLAGRTASAQLMKDQGDLLHGLARQVSSQLDQALAERLLDLQTLINFGQFQQGDAGRAEQREQLNALARAFTAYAWIGFADPQGRVLVSTRGLLEGAQVSARPWFQAARHEPNVQDLHQALLLGEHLKPESPDLLRFVDVAAPVFDAENRWIGVLGAHLYADWASGLLNSIISPIAAEHQVQVLVLNSKQEIVIGPKPRIGEIPPLKSVAAAVTQRDGYTRERWLGGQSGLTAYATADGFRNFPGLGWHVLMHRPEADLLQPARQLQWQMALIGLACAVVFAALMTVLLRLRLRPLRDLAQDLSRAEQIADLENLDHGAGIEEVRLIEQRLRDLAVRIRVHEGELAQTRAARDHDQQQLRALRQSVATDPLTGALNRRGLEERIRRIQTSADRYPRPVSVILCDIDHFKQINDQYGHSVGDQVLQRFARITAEFIRDTDAMSRTGGEEFVLLLPEMSQEQAASLAERLRSAVSARPFLVQGSSVTVTASYGVASAEADQSTPIATLIETADERMYAAKRGGRNQVRSS